MPTGRLDIATPRIKSRTLPLSQSIPERFILHVGVHINHCVSSSVCPSS